LVSESKWFTISYPHAASIMQEMFKSTKKHIEMSRKHRKYSKDNFSYQKMVEKMGTLIDDTKIPIVPKSVGLKLPKLKKVGAPMELPKLKLPKLKKI